jgi:hypothetical protein
MHASCDKLTIDMSVAASLAEHREHCHTKVQFLQTFLHLHLRFSVKVRVSSDSVSQEESRHSVGSQNDEFLRGGVGGGGSGQKPDCSPWSGRLFLPPSWSSSTLAVHFQWFQ